MSGEIDILSILSLLVSVPVVYAGLRFLLKGWRRRVGKEPSCRRCGYSLVGIAADVCPECGSSTGNGGILLGKRSPAVRPIATALAIWIFAFLLLATAMPTVRHTIASINLYHYRPVAWVMDDFRRGTGRPAPSIKTPLTQSPSILPVDLARFALEELRRRERAGKLPAKLRDELVETALAAEKSAAKPSPVQYDLLEYLSDHIIAGDLTAEQTSRFYAQAISLELQVRPVVLEHEAVPWRLRRKGESPAALDAGWETYFACKYVEIDDVQATRNTVYPPTSSATTNHREIDGGTPLAAGVGHHVLRMIVSVNVDWASGKSASPAIHMHNGTLSFSAPFDVVTPSAENAVQLIRDPAMGVRLKRFLLPGLFSYGDNYADDGVLGMIEVDHVPVNLAFDMFARYDGKEFPLSPFTMAAGEHKAWVTCHSPPGDKLPVPPGTIDLVFRSNPERARETVDLFQIWDGEIILRNVDMRGGRKE